MEAAQYGNLERCRELVEEEGVDVRQGDAEDITALHWAAINNRFAVARSVDMIAGWLGPLLTPPAPPQLPHSERS